MTDHDLVARIDSARTLLAEAAHDHGQAVLASSMGAEDMVLLDLIMRDRLPISVFTLDTGCLPQETLNLIARAQARYRITIDVYTPSAGDVEKFDSEHGSEGIYQSVDTRRACCAVRKVEPLRRALAGKGSWITGLRSAQSPTRTDISEKNWDSDHGLYKFNPLAAWGKDNVWNYLRERDVPYNELHDKGYASIGCAPCTRALKPGEDERAGRWWWESVDTRECGLHNPSDETTR